MIFRNQHPGFSPEDQCEASVKSSNILVINRSNGKHQAILTADLACHQFTIDYTDHHGKLTHWNMDRNYNITL